MFDAENRLWCLTDDGLFRARQIEVAERDFERVIPRKEIPDYKAHAVFADSRGRLWFGSDNQAIQIADGKTIVYEPVREANQPAAESPDWNVIEAFAEDEGGRVLAADTHGIYEFVEPQNEAERGAWRKLPIDFQAGKVSTITVEAGGGLWIGTNIGLMRYRDGKQTLYTTASGLSVNIITSLLTNREGNLWISTQDGGVNKMTGESIVNYTVAQGLPFSDVYRVTSDRDGNVFAQAGCIPRSFVQFTDEKMTVISNAVNPGICAATGLLQDRQRRWWFLSGRGLEISAAPRPDFTSSRLLTSADGLPEPLAEFYEDADGKIWAINDGKVFMTDATLAGTPRFELMTQGVPGAEEILRDSAGTVWIASRNQLWRLRNGKLEEIKQIENLPLISPRTLFEDSRGHVWIGTRYNGAIVTDEPTAENPRFKNYTVREGLASNTVWAIAEDNDGRIYFGTGRGVDQLDETTNKIRHFTSEDGIAGSVIYHLHKDRRGNIWVAANGGVSRINPHALRVETAPPPVIINRITIAGEELPLAETGVSNFSAADLSANQNNIAIRFVGLSFQAERALRYQYRLEGVDADWSAAGEQREVTYANLGAGEFRFLVRAVNSEGMASKQPAVFEFQILSPLWQRWWFVAGVLALTIFLIYVFYRYRLRRLMELERIRTRIATDLHDDIGANLTRISLLSEVAKQKSENGNGNLLTSIADIARESVSSMNDIVWAISPDHDSLLDLTRRMRRHAEEVFALRDVDLQFDAPTTETALKLSVGVRRDVLLIFKEAVNNAAKHSDCSRVAIDFRMDDVTLFLRIKDDGKGFDLDNKNGDGLGLRSMTRRADALGGKLKIESQKINGTVVEFKMPLMRTSGV